MSLLLQQKHDVEIMLEKKATLLEKRDANRKEVSRLKLILKAEEAKAENWELRCDLRHDIKLGNELAEKQTSLIMGLSMTSIARKVDADVASVIYYEKASINKPRSAKNINIPVFCAAV